MIHQKFMRQLLMIVSSVQMLLQCQNHKQLQSVTRDRKAAHMWKVALKVLEGFCEPVSEKADVFTP
jgi:hypothetical protein